MIRHLLLWTVIVGCIRGEVLFNPSIWKQSSHCKPIKAASKRIEMYKDLDENVLHGKNMDQIVNILGNNLPGNVLINHKRDLIYCLGRNNGMSMNWMLIHLKNGRYDKSEIVSGD